jgi:hypothetical protein
MALMNDDAMGNAASSGYAANPVIRRRVTGTGVGACTHDRNSVAGIVVTSQGPTGGNWIIHASGLRP